MIPPLSCLISHMYRSGSTVPSCSYCKPRQLENSLIWCINHCNIICYTMYIYTMYIYIYIQWRCIYLLYSHVYCHESSTSSKSSTVHIVNGTHIRHCVLASLKCSHHTYVHVTIDTCTIHTSVLTAYNLEPQMKYGGTRSRQLVPWPDNQTATTDGKRQ